MTEVYREERVEILETQRNCKRQWTKLKALIAQNYNGEATELYCWNIFLLFMR
jgi:hypothetical protein